MLFFFIPRIFQQICKHFAELRGVLGGDDRNAGLRLNGLPRVASHLATGTGHVDVFRKGCRCLLLGNFRGGGLRQHIQHQLQRGHVVTKVFLFESLQIGLLLNSFKPYLFFCLHYSNFLVLFKSKFNALVFENYVVVPIS